MRGERRRPTPHLGEQLHRRNRYKGNAPDFYILGQRYPLFQQYLRNVDHEKKRATLPFDDPHAVRELTRTLLLHDFGLDWTMPLDRLCPPLPNRLNYIHWIEDLLHSSGVNPFVLTGTDSAASIRGIDIGTGASCIYALLGAKVNSWSFLATEIDEISYQSALANVARNDLAALIQVKKVSTSQLLMEPLSAPPVEFQNQQIHFSMCNPPFFGDMSEADTNPDASCMGNTSEMVYPGGEVAFITHMIDDSLQLRDRVLVYTSMIGRKASLRQILAVLRTKEVQNVCSTEFFQGRTKRWGVAWSFADSFSLQSHTKVLGKRKEAHRLQQVTFSVPVLSNEAEHGCRSIDEVIQRVSEYTETLTDQHVELKLEDSVYWVICTENPTTTGDETSRVLIFDATIAFEEADGDDGYHVTIEFESGKREECWRFCDGLKAATIRSGRQWRRRRTMAPSVAASI